MESWITKNTTITKEEYIQVMGNLEIIRQSLIEKTSLSEREITKRIEQLKKEQEKQKCPTKKDSIMSYIEKFIHLYKGIPIYDAFLAHKMQIHSDKKNWFYEGISFDILSDYKNIPLFFNTHKPNEEHIYTTVLARYFKDSTIVIGKISDLKGGEYIHSFLIVENEVYDYSKNIVMEKELYYKMYQVKIINTLTSEEYLKLYLEYSTLKQNLAHNPATIIEFLCWPNEIIDGLKEHQCLKR